MLTLTPELPSRLSLRVRSITPLVRPDPRPTANGRSAGSRPCRNPNRGLELLAEAPANPARPGKSTPCEDTDPIAEMRRGRGDDEIELLGEAFATFDSCLRIGIDIGADPACEDCAAPESA